MTSLQVERSTVSLTAPPWRLAVCLMAAVLGASFWHPLVLLWHNWSRPQYSHGYLVPLLATSLFWHDLARAPVRPAPSWRGLWLIAAGYVLLTLGEFSTFNSAALYGLVLCLAGCLLCCLGGEALRRAVPALAYLCFAIPPPDFLYASFSAALQLFSSAMAASWLDLLGLPVSQDGNIIDLGVYKLQVAEACSGLRYLFPLASFSLLAAYSLKDRLWKRGLIFVSAVPIAVLLNVLRIVFVGITVDIWGLEAAEGLLHGFEGWAVFVVCCLLLLAETRVLQKMHTVRGGHFHLDYFTWPRGRILCGGPRTALPCLAGACLAALLAGSFAGLRAVLPHGPARAEDVTTALPLNAAGWRGHRGSLTADVVEALELTDYVMIDYQRRDAPAPVQIYEAFYAEQEIGSAVHSPANCIPGGGWAIIGRSLVTLHTANGPDRQVNRLQIRKDGETALVYYWFAQRGRVLTDEWQVKYYLLRDRIMTGRSDGYLVRFVTDAKDDQADARLQALFAATRMYLP